VTGRNYRLRNRLHNPRATTSIQSRTATEPAEPPQQITVEPPKEPEVQVSTLEPPNTSLAEDVLKLKHDYESKKEAAIQELLKKGTAIEKAFNENSKEIEGQLAELGYTREPDFVPVPASRVQPFRRATAKKSAREMVCPICTTDPENHVTGHDGRAHKSQGKRKRPFPAAELKAR
jgi:hypothetical protein